MLVLVKLAYSIFVGFGSLVSNSQFHLLFYYNYKYQSVSSTQPAGLRLYF